MKEKKIIISGLVILAMLFIFTAPASADIRSYTCYVDSVETDDAGVVTLTLRRTANDVVRSFIAPVGEENRVLSVALTAMSSGLTVNVTIDWTNPGSEIISIKLLASQ